MRRIAFELNGQDCGHLGGFDKNDWTRNSVPYGNEPFFFLSGINPFIHTLNQLKNIGKR